MRRIFTLLLIMTAAFTAAAQPVFTDKSAPAEKRAEDLVRRLTLEEI